MIRTVDALAGSAPIFAPEHADFSTSAAVIADMGTDPLIPPGGGPLHTAGQAIEGTHRLWAKVAAFDQPLLVVHGTIDKLTAPAGSRGLRGEGLVQGQDVAPLRGPEPRFDALSPRARASWTTSSRGSSARPVVRSPIDPRCRRRR